ETTLAQEVHRVDGADRLAGLDPEDRGLGEVGAHGKLCARQSRILPPLAQLVAQRSVPRGRGSSHTDTLGPRGTETAMARGKCTPMDQHESDFSRCETRSAHGRQALQRLL